DENGNYLRGWGGPGEGYEWPLMEHSMHVDHRGFVWLTSAKGDAPKGENHVMGAADLYVYAPTNELFVADGYRNRRVVVFDADTGAFKRFWGAYGNVPDDDAPKGVGGYGDLG